MDRKQVARNVVAVLAGVAIAYGTVWLVETMFFGFNGTSWGEGRVFEFVAVLVAAIWLGGFVAGVLSRLSFDAAIVLFPIVNVGLVSYVVWIVANDVGAGTMLVQAVVLIGVAYFGQLFGLYVHTRFGR